MASWEDKYRTNAAPAVPMAGWEGKYAAPQEPAREPEPEAPTGEDVPWSTRLAIGTARDADREETIKRYYPDAKKTDKGFHVFTSPKTGRPTYVNPPGADLGDIADWVRTGAEAVGGTAGAVGGAAMGNLPGAMLGAGAGSAVADQAVDAIRSASGLPQAGDVGSAVHNAAGDVLGGMAGEVGGRMVGQALKYGAKGLVRPGAQATIDAADKAGLPITASMTMRGPIAAAETTAAQVLPYSRPQRTLNTLYDKADEAIAGLKPDVPTPPTNAAEAAAQGGATLKTAADRAYATWKTNRLKLDDDFYAAVPPGVRFKLPSVGRAAADVQAEIAQSPGVQGEALKPVQGWLERISADLAANGGALPAPALRQLRTQLGAELETGATTDLAGPVQARLKGIYRAINDDLKAATAAVAPRARAALDRHDDVVKAFRGEDLGRESVAKALDSVLKKGADEQAWTAFTTGGAERLKTLIGTLTPDEHKVVARVAAERMTRTPRGNEATPTQWATEWLKTPPANRHALFGKVADVDKMNALAQVLREQQKNVPFVNTSRTAYELQRAGVLGNMVRAGIEGVGGHGIGVDTATGLKMAGLGYAASEALTHPRVLRGAVRAASGPVDDTILKRMIGQLGAQTGLDPLAELLPEGRRR